MNLKLVLGEEIYKFWNVPSSYEELRNLVQDKMGPSNHKAFKLKYRDAEDELITLNSQDDLQTAVLSCEVDNLKTLKIHVIIHGEEGGATLQGETKSKKSEPKGIEEHKVFHKHSINECKRLKIATPTSASGCFKAIAARYKSTLKRGSTYPLGKVYEFGKGNETIIEEIYGEDEVDSEVCDCCGKTISDNKYVCFVCKGQIYCEKCEQASEHVHPLLKIRNQHVCAANQTTKTCQIHNTSIINKNLLESTKRKFDDVYNGKKPDFSVKFSSNLDDQALVVGCGKSFKYSFFVENNGQEKWPLYSYIVCVNGVHKGKIRTVPSLNPGEKYEVNIILEGSKSEGKQLSQWRLHYKEKEGLKAFGMSFFIEILNVRQSDDVEREESKVSLKSTEKEEEQSQFKELSESRNVYHLAEALNDMFPGNIQAKVKFVESCPSHYDIYKLVDKYLLNLRKEKNQQPFSFNARPTFDVSI